MYYWHALLDTMTAQAHYGGIFENETRGDESSEQYLLAIATTPGNSTRGEILRGRRVGYREHHRADDIAVVEFLARAFIEKP